VGRAWLSLGSNIEPERFLRLALCDLRDAFGTLLESPVYRTAAVGFDGPDFLNMAVGLETDLDPIGLDAWLHGLEDRHGRRRDVPRFSSRTLDVDLLLYDDLVLRGPRHLELPRPDLTEHAFVLAPMADIAGDVLHPVFGRTIADLWRDYAGPRTLERIAHWTIAQKKRPPEGGL
jgi:2-amino-4-hydroxy-6-hydroxymethyldihydropteridine diphosphokinase